MIWLAEKCGRAIRHLDEVFDHDVRRHLQFVRLLNQALGMDPQEADGLSQKVKGQR